MAVLPLTGHVLVYPKNKTDEPYAATLVGLYNVTGLQVGGGPIVPPDEIDEIPVPPGFGIWGGSNEPFPTPPIYLPPDLPPVNPPVPPVAPHEGWNYSAAKSGWYYLYVPGAGDPQPKTP